MGGDTVGGAMKDTKIAWIRTPVIYPDLPNGDAMRFDGSNGWMTIQLFGMTVDGRSKDNITLNVGVCWKTLLQPPGIGRSRLPVLHRLQRYLAQHLTPLRCHNRQPTLLPYSCCRWLHSCSLPVSSAWLLETLDSMQACFEQILGAAL